jgi:predicted AAA+ superfamily ATPase
VGKFPFKRPMLAQLQARVAEPKLSFLQVLLGPRQTGKSTLLHQVAASWTGSKEINSADGLTTHAGTTRMESLVSAAE